jgi:hypothetical protein
MEYQISVLAVQSFISVGIILLGVILVAKEIYALAVTKKKKRIIYLVINSIVFCIVVGIFIVVPLFNGINVDQGELEINLTTGFENAVVTDDEIESAEIINLEEQSQYMPGDKEVGTQNGTYYEGVFYLKNNEKALVYINSIEVLKIELKEGGVLLLAPDDFEAFTADFSEKVMTIGE